MLQHAVDALFDNSRCKQPVLNDNDEPLSSLADRLVRDRCRFREIVAGKVVDYSAESAVVVDPSLALHQCGLRRLTALELMQPFVIRRLKDLGHAETIKAA